MILGKVFRRKVFYCCRSDSPAILLASHDCHLTHTFTKVAALTHLKNVEVATENILRTEVLLAFCYYYSFETSFKFSASLLLYFQMASYSSKKCKNRAFSNYELPIVLH